MYLSPVIPSPVHCFHVICIVLVDGGVLFPFCWYPLVFAVFFQNFWLFTFLREFFVLFYFPVLFSFIMSPSIVISGHSSEMNLASLQKTEAWKSRLISYFMNSRNAIPRLRAQRPSSVRERPMSTSSDVVFKTLTRIMGLALTSPS